MIFTITVYLWDKILTTDSGEISSAAKDFTAIAIIGSLLCAIFYDIGILVWLI